MATVLLGENEVHTNGELPAVGSIAPGFTLTDQDLKPVSLSDYRGKKVILNIFPSIETGVCSASVREFNKVASSLDNTAVVCISKDLPFAFKRFCGAEGIENVDCLSDFKNDNFADAYQNKLIDGGFDGLLSRCVIVIDEAGTVVYTEQVPAIGQEPNYEAALAAAN